MKITQFDIHTTENVNENLRKIASALINLAIETDLALKETDDEREKLRKEILKLSEASNAEIKEETTKIYAKFEEINTKIESLETRINVLTNKVNSLT